MWRGRQVSGGGRSGGRLEESWGRGDCWRRIESKRERERGIRMKWSINLVILRNFYDTRLKVKM